MLQGGGSRSREGLEARRRSRTGETDVQVGDHEALGIERMGAGREAGAGPHRVEAPDRALHDLDRRRRPVGRRCAGRPGQGFGVAVPPSGGSSGSVIWARTSPMCERGCNSCRNTAHTAPAMRAGRALSSAASWSATCWELVWSGTGMPAMTAVGTRRGPRVSKPSGLSGMCGIQRRRVCPVDHGSSSARRFMGVPACAWPPTLRGRHRLRPGPAGRRTRPRAPGGRLGRAWPGSGGCR